MGGFGGAHFGGGGSPLVPDDFTFGRPMRRPICSLKTSAATTPDLSDTAATYDGVALQLQFCAQDHRRAMLYLRRPEA